MRIHGLVTIRLVFLMTTVPVIAARGPHHPRGQDVAHHHVHYRPTRHADIENTPPPKLTQDSALLHDTEHLKEDLGDWALDKDLSTLSDDELEFHYFKLHDFDNNTQLDGLEILQAIHHTAQHLDEHEEERPEKDDFTYYVELIDRVLAEDDINGDGYLSYPEYVIGRMKDGDDPKYSTSPKVKL